MFGPVKKLARLGQWNGRKRSTRQEPFFRRLGQRRVLMRVAVVWLTTATVAGLAIWCWAFWPGRMGTQLPPPDAPTSTHATAEHPAEHKV